MYTDGYIKLHRNLLEWRWYKSKNTMQLYVHLLLRANYRDCEYMGETVKRGQLVTGRKKLCEELGLTEQELKTALQHLKSTNDIIIKTTSKYSIITVTCYDEYVEPGNKSLSEKPSGNQQATCEQKAGNQQETGDQPTGNQQATGEQPTGNQQATGDQPQYNKYNKYKKYNKDKKYNKSRNTRSGNLYELSDDDIESFRKRLLFND